MTQQKEMWTEAIGFHGLLEVSNLGNFRTIERTVKGRTYPQRILNLKPYNNGYMYARLRIEGITHRSLAHRVIWTSFNGEIEDGLQINHKDGDKTNNNIDNLEVVTPKENIKHSYDVIGRKAKSSTVFTEELVLKWAKMRSKAQYTETGFILPECNKKIAEALNLTIKQLHNIPCSHTYKKLKNTGKL